jgi:hypothetical protein
MTTGRIRFTPTRTGWNLRDFPGNGAPLRAKARRCVWANREMGTGDCRTTVCENPYSAEPVFGEMLSCAAIGIAVIVSPCFAQEDQRANDTHFGPFQNHAWPPLADVMLDRLLQMPGLNKLARPHQKKCTSVPLRSRACLPREFRGSEIRLRCDRHIEVE